MHAQGAGMRLRTRAAAFGTPAVADADSVAGLYL